MQIMQHCGQLGRTEDKGLSAGLKRRTADLKPRYYDCRQDWGVQDYNRTEGQENSLETQKL